MVFSQKIYFASKKLERYSLVLDSANVIKNNSSKKTNSIISE